MFFLLRTLKRLKAKHVFALPEHLVTLGVWGTQHLFALPEHPVSLEGTANRQNLCTQSPDSSHACGRLVMMDHFHLAFSQNERSHFGQGFLIKVIRSIFTTACHSLKLQARFVIEKG